MTTPVQRPAGLSKLARLFDRGGSERPARILSISKRYRMENANDLFCNPTN